MTVRPWGFVGALVVLGVAWFLLPQRVLPWLALLLVLGALAATGGKPITEATDAVYGRKATK